MSICPHGCCESSRGCRPHVEINDGVIEELLGLQAGQVSRSDFHSPRAATWRIERLESLVKQDAPRVSKDKVHIELPFGCATKSTAPHSNDSQVQYMCEAVRMPLRRA